MASLSFTSSFGVWDSGVPLRGNSDNEDCCMLHFGYTSTHTARVCWRGVAPPILTKEPRSLIGLGSNRDLKNIFQGIGQETVEAVGEEAALHPPCQTSATRLSLGQRRHLAPPPSFSSCRRPVAYPKFKGPYDDRHSNLSNLPHATQQRSDAGEPENLRGVSENQGCPVWWVQAQGPGRKTGLLE